MSTTQKHIFTENEETIVSNDDSYVVVDRGVKYAYQKTTGIYIAKNNITKLNNISKKNNFTKSNNITAR